MVPQKPNNEARFGCPRDASTLVRGALLQYQMGAALYWVGEAFPWVNSSAFP